MKRGAIILALLVAACSTGTSSRPASGLPDWFITTMNEVSACTGLQAARPNLVVRPAAPCPTSGALRCLPGEPARPCEKSAATCGVAAKYDNNGTIFLTDQTLDWAAHELIHYLKHTLGHRDSGDHRAVEFERCDPKRGGG